MGTIFTKIINKEIPADILYENENVLAFRDINPQAPTHFLVIPKKEISTLNDIVESDKELIGELFIVAKDLAEKKELQKADIALFLTVMITDAKQLIIFTYTLSVVGK